MKLQFSNENNNMPQKTEQSLKHAYKYRHSISWRVLLLSFYTIFLHAKVAASATVEATTIGIAPKTSTTALSTSTNDILRRSIAVASGRAVTILCKTSKRSNTYFYDVDNNQRRDPLDIDNELLRPYAVLVLHQVFHASTYRCFQNEMLLSETVLTIDNSIQSEVRIEMGEKDDAALTCKHDEGQPVYFHRWIRKNLSSNETSENIITDIVAIDSRTSILLIRNATLQSSRFSCKYFDHYSIDESEVHVGTPPQPIENFTCESQNYRSMTCEFPDLPNFIRPTYKLTYFGIFHKDRKGCALIPAGGKRILIMNTTNSGNCTYYPIGNVLKFNLFSQNILGNYSKIFSINNNECVIPPKLKINTADITSNSVSLNWDDVQKTYYARPLVYDIHVKVIDMEEYSEISPCTKLNCSMTVRKLPYANWNYELTVKARVDAERSKWNEPTSVLFKTAARTPDRAPKTIIGGFYIHYNSTEKVICLYWEELAYHEENGPLFYYSVEELDVVGTVLNSKRTNETSMAFPWFDKPRVYEVRAVNTLGASEAVSRIKVNVPETKQGPQRVEQLLYNNGTLALKWKPPADAQQLPPSNYTVLWCQGKLLLPAECKGSLHFEVVDSTTTEYRMDSEDRSLIMAVAANYPSWSSGLHWKTCFSTLDGNLESVKPKATPTSARSIAISWNLEVTCTNAFEGYSITYCEVADDKQQNCIAKNETRQLKKSEIQNYTLVELQPYTWYRITMFLYGKAGRRSPPSDAIFCRTKEAAPEPPTNIRYENKTSNSVNIFWDAPKIINGNLTKYTVWQSSKNYKTSTDISVMNLAVPGGVNNSYKLEGLSSYTDYELWVTAWTTEESKKHESLKLKTLVGRPSAPRDVKLNRISDKYTLSWIDPEMPSGPVQLYELKFFEGDKAKVAFVERDINSTQHQCYLKYPGCTDGAQKLEVRAINEVPENELDQYAFPTKPKSTGQRQRRYTMPAISNSALHIQTTTSDDKLDNDAKLYESIFEQFDDAALDEYQLQQELECVGVVRKKLKIPTGFRWLKSAQGSSDLHSCETFPLQTLVASLIFVGMFIAMVSKSYNLYRYRDGIGVKLPDPVEEMISNKTKSLPDNTRENDSCDRSNELDTAEKTKESANLLNYGDAITITPCTSSTENVVRVADGSESVNHSSGSEDVDDKYRYMLKDELKSSESTTTLNDTSVSSHENLPLPPKNEPIQVPTRNDGYVGIEQLANVKPDTCVAVSTSVDSPYMTLHSIAPKRTMDATLTLVSDDGNVGTCIDDNNATSPPAPVNGMPIATPSTDVAVGPAIVNLFPKAQLFPNSMLATGNYVLPDALPKIAAAHIAPTKEDNEQVQNTFQQQMIPRVSYGYVTSDFWSMK